MMSFTYDRDGNLLTVFNGYWAAWAGPLLDVCANATCCERHASDGLCKAANPTDEVDD